MVDKRSKEYRSFKFDPGRFSLQTMEALHKKYSRDYLPFFQELSTLYKIGKNKKKITETIQLVERTRNLLADVIAEGSVGVEDAESLYELVEQIEDRKNYFLEEVQKVKALQEKISSVEKETGISLQDLNVTRELVREGVRRSRRPSREGIGSRLQKAAPGLYGMGAKGAQALGTSLLGPFYPLAQAGVGLGRDIAGLRRQALERREKKLGASLRSSLRTSGFGGEGLQAARGEPPLVGQFRGGSQREAVKRQAAPLKEFFDKGAYKAKWTKELLRWMKKAADKKGISSLTKGLTAGLGKLAGAGAVVAGAGAVGYKLGQAIADYTKAVNAETESHERALRVHKMWQDQYEKDAAEIKATRIRQEKETADVIHKLGYDPNMAERNRILGVPPVSVTPQIKRAHEEPIETIRKAETEKITAAKEAKFPEIALPPIPGVDVLGEYIQKLTEQLRRNQNPPVFMGGAGGNIFDSGDTLINEHANGSLTLDEK